MNRKKFLLNSLTGLAAFTAIPATAMISSPPAKKKNALRLLHIADLHIDGSKDALEGTKKLIQSISDLKLNPDMIINTGDHIRDGLNKSMNEIITQFSIYKADFVSKCPTKVFSCIGNHDIYGWENKDVTIGNPDDSKKIAIEQLEMPGRYYSHVSNGWYFIFLDNIFYNADIKHAYIGKIDNEQFEWLQAELKKTKNMNVCIVGHIPILSIAAYFSSTKVNNHVEVPNNLMHTDFWILKDLFSRYPNVRLALSGHLHMHDVCRYLNVTYSCAPSASGAWWKGKFKDFYPSYTVVDLNTDGSSDIGIVNYTMF